MNDHDRSSRQLTAGLVDLAGTGAPDYRNDILGRVARTRQRPAWVFPERWIPMTLVAQGRAPSRPLTRSPRPTWQFTVVLALTLAMVAGLAIAGAHLLLPAPPDRGFNSLVTVPVFELDTDWDPAAIEGLLYPVAMDVGPDGNLYVVSAGTSEVLVVDPSGAVVRRYGERGTGDGQFDFLRDPKTPTGVTGGVAVAPDGSEYVADTVNDRIQQFQPDGTFVRQWGGFGLVDGTFLEPIDLAVGPDGSVFVVDDRRDDIQRFTADGVYIETIGSAGTGDGQMNNTGSVFVDGSGNLLNADFDNHRVQAWDQSGTFLWTLGAEQGATFRSPADVGTDAAGNMYVTDESGLQVFDAERHLVSTWTPPEMAAKEEWLAMSATPDGTVYVASMANSVVWRLDRVMREVDMSPAPSAAAVSPSPSAAAVPSRRPSPVPTGSVFTVDGAGFPVPFTLQLPPSWREASTSMSAASVRRNGGTNQWPAYVGVSIPANAFADPCHAQDGPMSPPVGPGIDDLATALTNAVGMRAGPITDVTIDGFHGKAFDLDNNIDIRECSDNPWLRQWSYASNGGVDADKQGGLPGSHQRVAILDVRGTRVLVDAWTFGETSAEEVAEANQVFDSIDFQ